MEMLSHIIYICRATRCCKVIQHHSAILISLVFDHLGNHQTMPAVQFWWLKSRLAVRPDGAGLPLGWPTIYRAGPGYLLGVPQMLHPEPKKKAFMLSWLVLTIAEWWQIHEWFRVNIFVGGVRVQPFFLANRFRLRICNNHTFMVSWIPKTRTNKVVCLSKFSKYCWEGAVPCCAPWSRGHLADIPWIRQGWWSNRWSRDWSPSPVMGPGPRMDQDLRSFIHCPHGLGWTMVNRCALVGKGATTRRAYGKTMRKARFWPSGFPCMGSGMIISRKRWSDLIWTLWI